MKPFYEDDLVTLWHGDCREVTAWLDADVLVTDPPYEIAGGRLGKHEGGRKPVHADAGWDLIAVRDAALELWGDRPRAVFGSPRGVSLEPARIRTTGRIMTARWDDATDQAIRDALAADDPAAALRQLTQGCNESTCRYRGAANRTLRTITNGEQK